MGHISRGGEDLEDREDARRRLADDGVERPGTPFHTIIGTRNRDRNVRARKCQPLLSLSGETASRPPACWGHIDGERKFSCCGFYLLVSNAGVQNANACRHCKQELMVKASMQAYILDRLGHISPPVQTCQRPRTHPGAKEPKLQCLPSGRGTTAVTNDHDGVASV